MSIYIPPPAIRDLRELVRGRHHLVRLRARVMQPIKALLLRPDAKDPPVTRLTSARGLRWLEEQPLPGAAGETVQRRRRAPSRSTPKREPPTRRSRRAPPTIGWPSPWRRSWGGPVLALTLRAAIGRITRFRRWPELASYAGLVNGIDASASRIRCGPITRQGSPWLRWALGEAAIHAMHRPDATGRWARRLAGRISICPARVALARVLCRDVVRVWRTAEGE